MQIHKLNMPPHTHRKASINYIQLIATLMLVIFYMGYIGFSGKESLASYQIQDALSDEGMKVSVFNALIASPCTNNNYLERSEVRKYIIDDNRADIESENIDLSCSDIANIKYRIDIKDLQSEKRWTFANYQPVEAESINPDYDMIVQVNVNSIEPEEEGMYVQMDEYHVALLTATIESTDSGDKLLNEMYCEPTASDRVTISDSGDYVLNAYRYNTNNCFSETCVKGPGQLNATCQQDECKYDLGNGKGCMSDCTCKSTHCIDGKCSGDAPNGLVRGQPCVGKYADKCATGLVCAVNKRCADEYDTTNLQISGTVLDIETGEPISGASITFVDNSDTPELDEDKYLAITDSEGYFVMPSYMLANLFDDYLAGNTAESSVQMFFLKVTKDGYNECISDRMALRVGSSPVKREIRLVPEGSTQECSVEKVA